MEIKTKKKTIEQCCFMSKCFRVRLIGIYSLLLGIWISRPLDTAWNPRHCSRWLTVKSITICRSCTRHSTPVAGPRLPTTNDPNHVSSSTILRNTNDVMNDVARGHAKARVWPTKKSVHSTCFSSSASNTDDDIFRVFTDTMSIYLTMTMKHLFCTANH